MLDPHTYYPDPPLHPDALAPLLLQAVADAAEDMRQARLRELMEPYRRRGRLAAARLSLPAWARDWTRPV